jgi:hypothetical protein
MEASRGSSAAAVVPLSRASSTDSDASVAWQPPTREGECALPLLLFYALAVFYAPMCELALFIGIRQCCIDQAVRAVGMLFHVYCPVDPFAAAAVRRRALAVSRQGLRGQCEEDQDRSAAAIR